MPKSSATVRPKPPLYWNAKQNENRWQSMKGKIAAIEKRESCMV